MRMSSVGVGRSITRALAIATASVAIVTGVDISGGPAQAAPEDSIASRLILGATGLPPMQALLQITREVLSEDAPYVAWTKMLPPASVGYIPPRGVCPSGDISCVDDTISELQRRADDLTAQCSDNATLVLSYLQTTTAHRGMTATGAAFGRDTAHANDWSVSYAHHYFRAYDNYYLNGRRDLVPESWQQSFRASDDRSLTVLGGVAAAYNAHITHDLPQVISEMGVTSRDGRSYKPVHEKINEMLALVERDIVAELGRRYGDFDPAMRRAAGIEPATGIAFGQAIQLWREYAWRAAEALIAAPDGPARQVVEDQIDGISNLLGEVIGVLFTRLEPGPYEARCPIA